MDRRRPPDDRRDLRILVGAVGLSTLGDAAALTALVVLVHEGTGSSLAVAGLLLGVWGPVVVLGGVAGALVDRVENVRLLVLGAAGQAAVVLAMIAAGTPEAAVLLAPLLGAGSAVVQPAEQHHRPPDAQQEARDRERRSRSLVDEDHQGGERRGVAERRQADRDDQDPQVAAVVVRASAIHGTRVAAGRRGDEGRSRHRGSIRARGLTRRAPPPDS